MCAIEMSSLAHELNVTVIIYEKCSETEESFIPVHSAAQLTIISQ